MKLSLVVPCFNEEDNILPFYKRVREVFENKIEYEIVFVNDGSRDKTGERLHKLLETADGNIKVLTFSRNFGKESAMYAGLGKAEGEYTAIIDADLQQDPEYVLQMSDMLDKNADLDCVCAYQAKRKETSLTAMLKGCFYSLADALSDVPFHKDASDFRVFRRNVLQAVLSLKEYKRFSKGIFSFVGFNTEYISYEVKERFSGKTKWSVKALFRYAFDGLFSFSVKPLKLVGTAGILNIIISVILLVAFAITGLTVEKWLLISLFMLTGVVLISLGIVSEYVARGYVQNLERPVYIIKEYKEKQAK